MELDPQARQLNETIRAANPAVLDMLSQRGKGIFFPKLGILSQSADAKGKAIDATIGIALEENGAPMALPSLSDAVQLSSDKVFPYAPSPGRPDLRAKWKEMILAKNPGLKGKTFGQPVVTSALTHGLSMAGYLFGDAGDRLVISDLYWENYDLVFTRAFDVALDAFPTFDSAGGFNVAGLRERLLADSGRDGKVLLSLNFPNNPTGYTATEQEVEAITAVILEAAKAGKKIIALIDDAYFGLVFEKGIYTESIFSVLCDLHPNVLAVKVDGPTKEDYVWGFRVGFLTFGMKGGTEALYGALEAKAGGAIRGNISNSSHPAQSLLLQAYSAADYNEQKRVKYDLLKKRYDRIKTILAAHPEYAEEFASLPFNSGYFMCIRPKRVQAETLRQKLLQDYSTGVIALSGIIRLAFSATPTDKLEQLFANIYSAAKSL